jgi:S1-C subfamily serine protease
MDIQGTAFQVGKGKLLTCWHVCETLRVREREAYFYAKTRLGDSEAQRPYPVAAQLSFIDPRTDAANPLIDVGMLISPATDSEEYPYLVPPVRWGDSTKLGVGDRVVLGGFPLGKEMFFATSTNRGLVQPTFYEGIISAIIPAINAGETRLLQVGSVALGGISGGVVCEPRTGKVIGMVTSGLTDAGVALPITYAIPSEVLHPWAESISFKTDSGEIWR